MTAERNFEAVRKLYDAYETGGLEAGEAAMEEILDPEVEFSPWLARELERRVYRGHAEVRAFFEGLMETLGDLRYEDTRLEQASDGVIVALTRMTGVPRGAENRVSNDLGVVFEVDDGRVVRYTAYGSHDEAREAARELVHAEA